MCSEILASDRQQVALDLWSESYEEFSEAPVQEALSSGAIATQHELFECGDRVSPLEQHLG
ncbi:hypothetical protein FM119_05930 [Mycetocola reblochoni REB411]|uniref:Uncharacterized protein n=1 Tax=Mycetocola reblochoni REB411 TaxID=1255698 RepID=A0A1R4J899_9MICO|nr:hypothetical protein FM119_05930 [Mycetocola reblochoni REB411]